MSYKPEVRLRRAKAVTRFGDLEPGDVFVVEMDGCDDMLCMKQTSYSTNCVGLHDGLARVLAANVVVIPQRCVIETEDA